MTIDLDSFARELDAASRDARPLAQITAAAPDLTLDQAYAIQARAINHRLARGERRIGVKMGFTSRAKMAQMGVCDLIWGHLTDAMAVPNGGAVDFGRFIHPRVEPEIAFLLGRPLHGRVTLAEALAAVAGVAPALEIIDSRYENFKFSVCDVVADNSSASAFAVGDFLKPEGDLSNLGLVMSFNGTVTQCGSSAAILGHPLAALVEAARLADAAGFALEPGDIVLAGAATAAEPLARGIRVEVAVQNLGRCGFQVR